MAIDILVHRPKVVCLLMEAGPVFEIISLDLVFHIKRRLNSRSVASYLEWAKETVGHTLKILRVTLTEIY